MNITKLARMTRRTALSLAAGLAGFALVGTPAQAVTEMTVATFHPRSGSADVESLYHFKEILEERSDGDIKVKVFYGGSLGGERELVEQLKLETVHMCLGAWATHAAYVNDLMPWNVPYLFSSQDQISKMANGRLGEALKGAYAKQGIIWAGVYFRGNRQLTANREVHAPADIEGMKIRLPEDPDWLVVWRALGTQPVPIPAPEVFSALQTGVVEAQENPISSNYGRKIWEVQKYTILTNHVIDSNSLLLSKKFVDALPQDQRKLVLTAAQDTLTWATNYAAEKEASMKKEMEGHGMEFLKPDLQAFRAVAETTLDYFKKQWQPWVAEEVSKAIR